MAEQKRKRPFIVVDGANVAFEEASHGGKPRVSNLVAMRRLLRERGYEAIILVDASLRHEVDDPDQLEALIEAQDVRQVPAGTDADYFVLKTAEQQDALVVSNDRYKDRRDEFPWVDERRVPFMIVQGQVQIYEDRLQQAA